MENGKTIKRTWADIIEKQNQRDKQDNSIADHFKGKLKKAVLLMKKLHDMDDDIPDKVFYKTSEKVKYWIDREELEIELARKALEKRENEIYKLTSSMAHNSYDMWFYYVKEKVLKEIGEKEI